jgi:hypothetical protein
MPVMPNKNRVQRNEVGICTSERGNGNGWRTLRHNYYASQRIVNVVDRVAQ